MSWIGSGAAKTKTGTHLGAVAAHSLWALLSDKCLLYDNSMTGDQRVLESSGWGLFISRASQVIREVELSMPPHIFQGGRKYCWVSGTLMVNDIISHAYIINLPTKPKRTGVREPSNS